MILSNPEKWLPGERLENARSSQRVKPLLVPVFRATSARNDNLGQNWYPLVIQWLRFHTPNAGGLCSIPGQGTKSHMPQLKIPQVAPKTWCSKINKYFFNFTKGQSTLSSQNHFWISQPSSNEHLKVQPHPCWATSWFLLDVICEAILLGWKTLRLEIGWSSWSWCRAKINIRLWHSEGLENWLWLQLFTSLVAAVVLISKSQN